MKDIMNKIPNIEEEYTSHEALKEWEEEKDQNNLTQNIVALLGIHGMHCKFYEYQNASHITKAFEDLFHHQLQKAREEERDRCIAETELMMLQEDCEIFGAAPEDIARMNSLNAYIQELTNPNQL